MDQNWRKRKHMFGQ